MGCHDSPPGRYTGLGQYAQQIVPGYWEVIRQRYPERLIVRQPIRRVSDHLEVSHPGQGRTVPVGHYPAPFDHASQLAELDNADSRLDVGHPVVVPGLQVLLDDRLATRMTLCRADAHAMFSQPTQPG